MESLNYQLKLMTLVMVFVEIGVKGNVPMLTIRHQHAECCRHQSYSGSYCESNIKSETEIYAAHLIFMQ